VFCNATMSASRHQLRSRPSSLNLDAKITIPPSRSVSFHGSSSSKGYNGSVPGATSQYWRQQQQLHRSQTILRRQSSYSRRGQLSTSPRGVVMMKLLNDGMQWNGTIYRNNPGRWRDSWTLLDNPILMSNAARTTGSSSSSGDVEDEGFYGSCCLGDYADMNGKSNAAVYVAAPLSSGQCRYGLGVCRIATENETSCLDFSSMNQLNE
jgi:hypothetical protein